MDITNLNLVISILRTPFGTLDLGKGGNAKKYKREKIFIIVENNLAPTIF